MFGVTRSRVIRLLPSAVLLLGLCFVATPAFADKFTSPNYTIDASTMNNFGGSGSSTSYKLVSSGGESVIGSGTGGSYKLGEGYVAQLVTTPAIQLTVQPSSLTAYYPLDEASSTNVWDSSANAHNGSTVGAPARGSAGQVGSALNIDGTTQYATVPHAAGLSVTGDLTVEAWIKVVASGDFSTSPALVSKGSGQEFEIGTNSTRRIRFGWNDGTPITRTGTNPVGINSWSHVAVVRSGTTLNMFINGVLDSTHTITAPVAGTGPLRIGTKDGTTSMLKGLVDEVKIYSRALTDVEVKAEYDAGALAIPAGLGIGTVTPGTSKQINFDTIVKATSDGGYGLTVAQNNNLTNAGAATIAGVSGTIASPAAWAEGTTKGLGFSLTSAPSIDPKWGAGTNYAAFPGSATSFYNRTGSLINQIDVIGMRARLDITTTQQSGDYKNTVTITGTTTP